MKQSNMKVFSPSDPALCHGQGKGGLEDFVGLCIIFTF